jgi:UDP-N-acetylmuramyl tripeptide synthase
LTGPPVDHAAPLFADSRRLLGPSFWLDGPGAVLEIVHGSHPHAPFDDLAALHRATDDWRARIEWLTDSIGWRGVRFTVHRHPGGATLAFSARFDVLFAATAMNEWAWRGAAVEAGAPDAEVATEPDALPLEANPELRALAQAARIRGVPVMVDEQQVTCGYGIRALSWPVIHMDAPEQVNWDMAGDIPVALVTGSNGKTTTTRLVVAMLTAAGHRVGYCCSDGVSIDGIAVEHGDWSGPLGARRVLRDPSVTAAVLETARGGLLRRGLVVPRANVAVVTNVAADHLGEYGIHTVEELARVKLGLAAALGDHGTIVLNADDPVLMSAAGALSVRHRTFSTAEPFPASVPSVAEMPITANGTAAYNVSNALAAAHAASLLGVSEALIRSTLETFGTEPGDNPGRLMRFEVGGVRVILDYAHNPHGLAALLGAARIIQQESAGGRLLLLLGQAGDRSDADVRALARVAWDAAPDRIILKDLDGYLRGRTAGEVPNVLRAELLAAGAPADRLETALQETEAVRHAFAWARPGDLLVLPVHALAAREGVLASIASLRATGWQAGDALP